MSSTPSSNTKVNFERAGVAIAEVVVPGRLLEFDVPASVERRSEGANLVRLIENSNPLLECCGVLTLPWVNRDGPGVSELVVPPPEPFSANDVETMWLSRNELRLTRRRGLVSGQADWSRLEKVLGPMVNWPELRAAVQSAARLLQTWPVSRLPSVEWLEPDRAGGRVLVGVTERRVLHGDAGAGNPSRVAHRASVRQERRLHALAAVTALLADLIGLVPGLDAEPQARDRLMGLFAEVSRRASPRRPIGDPPPSAWPNQFAATYSACLQALSVVRDLGPGQERASLVEVFELYEAWVAIAFRDLLTAELGPSMATAGHCLGRWIDGEGTVELHDQAGFSTVTPRVYLMEEYIAIIGNLVPDLLLVRRAAGTTRAVALDAKKRVAPVEADDLVENASKYLWGIRRLKAPATGAGLQAAVIVAPLGGVGSGRPEGRAWVTSGHPRNGLVSEFAAQLLHLVR